MFDIHVSHELCLTCQHDKVGRYDQVKLMLQYLNLFITICYSYVF